MPSLCWPWLIVFWRSEKISAFHMAYKTKQPKWFVLSGLNEQCVFFGCTLLPSIFLLFRGTFESVHFISVSNLPLMHWEHQLRGCNVGARHNAASMLVYWLTKNKERPLSTMLKSSVILCNLLTPATRAHWTIAKQIARRAGAGGTLIRGRMTKWSRLWGLESEVWDSDSKI